MIWLSDLVPMIGSYFGTILLETFWGNFILFFLNFEVDYLYESQTLLAISHY